jgi:hypothetical protein
MVILLLHGLEARITQEKMMPFLMLMKIIGSGQEDLKKVKFFILIMETLVMTVLLIGDKTNRIIVVVPFMKVDRMKNIIPRWQEV